LLVETYFQYPAGSYPSRGPANFWAVEGIPDPFDQIKRVVVPDAIRLTRLKPGRKFTHLGKLATELGWGYSDVVKRYEDARKEKAAQWYEGRKASKAAFAKAQAAAK
jgi:large subunit ribosomal protein L13Ae